MNRFSTKLALQIIAVLAISFLLLYFFSVHVSHLGKHTGIPDSLGKISGFWGGLIDGLLVPYNMIWSLVATDCTVFNEFNSGPWYVFAFLLPVIVYFILLVWNIVHQVNQF